MAAEHLGGLSRDLLVEVLGRIDSASLASAACACTSLRGAAKEEALWAELCRRTWPSTADSTSRELVSSMPGGFAKLYADSLPLLVYKSHRPRGGGSGIRSAAGSSSELISFVDVYYKKKCVLSRVVRGMPLHDDSARAGPLARPFKVDAMGDLAVCVGGDGEETGAAPSIALDPKEEGGAGVLNWALEEDLTLSWVLLDVGSGRAVNLSGGRPTSVQRDCPSKGDMVVWFGCAVPVEKQLLAACAAECAIAMRCRRSEEAEEDWLRCTGIELQVKDAEGAALPDQWRSLAVLERALCWEERSRKRGAAAAGYRAYVKDCTDTRREQGTGVVERLCALAGLLLLVTCWVSPLVATMHGAEIRLLG